MAGDPISCEQCMRDMLTGPRHFVDVGYQQWVTPEDRDPRTIYMYPKPGGGWEQRDEPLPSPPKCFLCGAESPHLTLMPFGSDCRGEWICPEHLDEAVDLLKAKKGGE